MKTGIHTVLAVLLTVATAQSFPAQGTAPAHPPAAVSTPAERQKAALAEADHLFALAQQLKVTLDKTRRDELSMQVIHQADEIEKLARSVKSQMH